MRSRRISPLKTKMKICLYLKVLRTGDWETYEKKIIALRRLKRLRWCKWEKEMRERQLVDATLRNLRIFHGSKEDYERKIGHEVEIIPSPYRTITYYYDPCYGGRVGPFYHMRGLEKFFTKERIEALVFAREIQREGFAGLYPVEWEGVPIRKNNPEKIQIVNI